MWPGSGHRLAGGARRAEDPTEYVRSTYEGGWTDRTRRVITPRLALGTLATLPPSPPYTLDTLLALADGGVLVRVGAPVAEPHDALTPFRRDNQRQQTL